VLFLVYQPGADASSPFALELEVGFFAEDLLESSSGLVVVVECAKHEVDELADDAHQEGGQI
jgi:hypothetical protein